MALIAGSGCAVVKARTPLVSCLCVTESRAAFMPWLLWNFDRQSWPAKELVIVDSSARPFSTDRRDVRVVPAAPRTGVAEKRNRALEAACGSIVAWFDDDDWQHPLRLERSIELLRAGVPCVGPRSSWMLDLVSGRIWRFRGFEQLMIFNGSAFTLETARARAFDPGRRRASDTVWLSQLAACGATEGWCPLELTSFFWIHHGKNLSVSARRSRLRPRLFPGSRCELTEELGAEAWGDSGGQLALLCARLGLAGWREGSND